MHAPELFRSRAAECEAMAKIAREDASKVIWRRMAERWRRCAEMEVRAGLAAAQQHGREGPPGWSRH